MLVNNVHSILSTSRSEAVFVYHLFSFGSDVATGTLQSMESVIDVIVIVTKPL